jgi:ATP-dependent DNA helicase RecQ
MPNSNAQSALQKFFGLESFRYPQKEIIDSILEGRSTLVIMPTGGGKSLCYQLPAMLLPGVTIVVSPLIALMKDQVDALKAKGIPAAMLNSSQNWSEQRMVLDNLKTSGLKLLYVAPERFRARSFVDALKSVQISLFAVDEAHCISQWGHDFRPDYMRLGEALQAVGKPTVCAAFTATATPDVRADISKNLRLQNPRSFVSGFARNNLTFSIFPHFDEGIQNRSACSSDRSPYQQVLSTALLEKASRKCLSNLMRKG